MAWNDRFASWALAPSQTEIDRIDHAITAIRKALQADSKMAAVTKIFVQGSYRNRVNVRQDSDVDIGVLYTGNVFFADYPDGKGHSDFGNVNAPYGYAEYKNDIGRALINYFGSGHVSRGDKAFDVHENSYRVDADVVPLFVHRRYWANGGFFCGTELHPDSGGRIINWPERIYDTPNWPDQHYEKGNTKNNETRRAYRGVVRIIKKLRNMMDEEGIPQAKPVKGFNIECLVWNVPNLSFMHATWYEDVAAVLNHLSIYLSSMLLCGGWTEVSGWKSLLNGDEVKRRQLEAFVDRARRYIGVI